MSEPCDTPPRESMMHDIWFRSLRDLVDKYGPDSAIGDLADFASNVLELCGDTPLLTEYLNERALDAMKKGK